MLNDTVEKQLSAICRKGKLFDIDVTDCTTQDSSDDSSDFSCLSHDHEQKRDLKKKKVKKDTFFGKSNKSSENMLFPNQQNQWIHILIRILRIIYLSNSCI
jgi:hypothetical protein